MKKLLLLVAVLLSTARTFAQGYSAPVRVIIQNKTPFYLSYAPRYHLAFFDGINDHSSFGVSHDALGWPTPTDPGLANLHRDFNYQQEGVFEPVLNPGQTRVYMNTTLPGYGFQPNGTYSSFNTTGVGMNAYGIAPGFFHKYMRLDWLRFQMGTTPAANTYGGGIAHPVPSGFTYQAGVPAPTGGAYIGPNSEMVIPFWSSTQTFTVAGTTVNAVWTATTYVPGQAQTVNILFY